MTLKRRLYIEWQIFKESWPYHSPNIFSYIARRFRDVRRSREIYEKVARHLSTPGICRRPGETDAELRARVKRIMTAPYGGNG